MGVSLLPQTLPRVNEIGLDWPVMLFALGLALLTGFLCGLTPAFAAIRTSVNETLKEGGRTGTGGSGHARLRSALVVAEIAVALTLLTASGLLLRSFEKMRDVKVGLPPRQYAGCALRSAAAPVPNTICDRRIHENSAERRGASAWRRCCWHHFVFACGWQ